MLDNKNELLVSLCAKFTNCSRNSKLISIGLSVASLDSNRESFYAEFNDFSVITVSDFANNEIIPKLMFNDVNEFQDNDGIQKVLMKDNTREIKKVLKTWLHALHATYNRKIKFIINNDGYDWILFREIASSLTATDDILPDYMDSKPIDIESVLEVLGLELNAMSAKLLLDVPKDANSDTAIIQAKMMGMFYIVIMNSLGNSLEQTAV